MPFKAGQPRLPNAGRRKGTPNKLNRDIGLAIERALFELHGGGTKKDPAAGAVSYFKWLAEEHPAVFGGILKQKMPKVIDAKGAAILLHVERDFTVVPAEQPKPELEEPKPGLVLDVQSVDRNEGGE